MFSVPSVSKSAIFYAKNYSLKTSCNFCYHLEARDTIASFFDFVKFFADLAGFYFTERMERRRILGKKSQFAVTKYLQRIAKKSPCGKTAR